MSDHATVEVKRCPFCGEEPNYYPDHEYSAQRYGKHAVVRCYCEQEPIVTVDDHADWRVNLQAAAERWSRGEWRLSNDERFRTYGDAERWAKRQGWRTYSILHAEGWWWLRRTGATPDTDATPHSS